MIEFKNLTKKYDKTIAVNDVSLKVEKNEFVVFVGLSGSGKTTSLSTINRMIDPTSGQVFINGEDNQTIDPVDLRRKIGYVIQGTGLLPHFTVYKNISTVPRLLGWDEHKMRERAEELVRQVDLPLETLDQYPNQLSGGQQQRVGVIRALAANPEIILMDEPFGALDPITRESLQNIVLKLKNEEQRTFVFVTHDIEEALKLADKIAIWENGKVVQYDKPENILLNPATRYVKELIGDERIVAAQIAHTQIKDIVIQGTAPVGTSTKRYQADEYVGSVAREILLTNHSAFEVVNTNHERIGYVDKSKVLEIYEQIKSSREQVG